MVQPRNLGKYRIIAELGHGGMAEVFLSMVAGPLGSGFSKLAVVKRLRPNLVEATDFVAMLVDEARISARLNHPNVVQTHEVDVDRGEYFIAMEFLDGQPFHRIQRRAERLGAPLPAEYQYTIVADALAGLQHAHELRDYDGSPMGIVHRDVTPQNIFVTYDGQVKVVDFGIAKAEGRMSETRQGIVKGKVRYMSPEQATGQTLDCRSDIFAAGVLLWEAAVGRKFWEGRDDMAIVQVLVAGEYDPSPRTIDPSVPAAIDAMCRKAMAFDANERYASAADFRLDLETFISHRIVAVRRALGPLVAQLFAKERETLRGVVERSTRGNHEPMSLVTFTSTNPSPNHSQDDSAPWSTPLRDEAVPEAPNADPRPAAYLALVAVAASFVLFLLSRPVVLGVAELCSAPRSSPEVAQVVAARTELSERMIPRGKSMVRANLVGEAPPIATPVVTKTAHEHAPSPLALSVAAASTPAAPPMMMSATLQRDGARRRRAIDTSDPWGVTH